LRLVFGTVDLPDTSVAPRVLDRFYAAGGRALDVANVYRDGESAQAVGRWLRERHSPDGVVLYAKGCHPPNCLPELVPAEVDEARRLLGVERIDVFVLHRDDPSLPVAAFADALLEQVAAEKIGGFGVSNWTVPRLRELQRYLDGPARTASSSSATTSRSPRWWPSHGRVPGRRQGGSARARGHRPARPRLVEPRDGFFAGRDPASWDSR
jgi:aryl-alcohol dehydrogenase-like predicted oxidoreductase